MAAPLPFVAPDQMGRILDQDCEMVPAAQDAFAGRRDQRAEKECPGRAGKQDRAKRSVYQEAKTYGGKLGVRTMIRGQGCESKKSSRIF